MKTGREYLYLVSLGFAANDSIELNLPTSLPREDDGGITV